MAFKEKIDKFKNSRVYLVGKKVVIGLSFVFNAIFLLLLLVGLATPNVVSVSASDNVSSGSVPSVSNPLNLADGSDDYRNQVVAIGDDGGYYRLPSSVEGVDEVASGYFNGTSFDTSSGASPVNVGIGGGSPSTFEVFSASPYVLSLPTMPGLVSWLDISKTFYLSFGQNGNLVWSLSEGSYNILSYTLSFGLISYPSTGVFASGVYLVSSTTIEYSSFPLVEVGASGNSFITDYYNRGLFSPPLAVSITCKSTSGWDGTYYLTRTISGSSYDFYGFNTGNSSVVPFSDLSVFLPTSTSLASSFDLSCYLFSPSSLSLARPVSSYFDWLGYGTDYDMIYNEGYGDGNEAGYNTGYDDGFEAGIASGSPITSFSGILANSFNAVASVLNLNLFGLTLGTWLFIPLTVGLIFLVLKMFNHG